MLRVLISERGVLWFLAATFMSCASHPTDADDNHAAPGSPAGLPLVERSDIAYLGAFRVPNRDNTGAATGSFAYGGHALGFNPANNSLYYGGHDWYQRLGEIAIPSTIALSSTAAVLQNAGDVTGDGAEQIDDGTVKLGGTLVYNGRLIVSAYSYYDADGNQSRSHFSSGNGRTNGSDIRGPFAVSGEANPRSKAGYMAIVPDEWRAALGGPALTGNCCLSIISASSVGPSVTVFDPDDVGAKNPVPGTTLLFYPLGNATTRDGTASNSVFVQSDVVAGLAFPRGTRSLLFVGRHGTGAYCYGPGTPNRNLAGQPSGNGADDWCFDPSNSSKGTHAYPYAPHLGLRRQRPRRGEERRA